MELPNLLWSGKELPFLEGVLENVLQCGDTTWFNVVLSNGQKTPLGRDPRRWADHPVSVRDGDQVRIYEVPDKEERLANGVLGIQVIVKDKPVYSYVAGVDFEGKELTWSKPGS